MSPGATPPAVAAATDAAATSHAPVMAPSSAPIADAAARSFGARLASASIVALTLAVIVMAVTPASADPDLWGHLRFGLDFFDTWRVDRPDIYSFLTAGVPWVNHEWLAEASFGLAWRLAGGYGLVLLKLVVSLATFAIVYRHLVWRGVSLLAASMLLLQAVPLTLPWIAVIRPQIYTYLGFAITLVAIARAEHGATRGLWGLAPVFLLWINLHGGVLAGLGILGLWLCARTVQQIAGAWMGTAVDGPKPRDYWPQAIVAILATLVNPYAARMLIFFRTALVSRPEISEWNPLEVMSLEGATHLLLLAPIVAGWIWSRREKRPALVFVFLWIAVLPVIARRNSPLFALGCIILGGEHLADATARLFAAWRAGREARRAAAATAIVAAAAAAPADAVAQPLVRQPHAVPALPIRMSAIFFAGAAGCVTFAASDLRITFNRADFPVEAISLLRASGVQTNLAVPMNWGEYVLWHVGPRVQVSMDGRRETVYTDEGYGEVLDFTFGTGRWDRLLDRPGVDLALVPTKDWPVYNLMRLKPGWSRLFEDDRSALFGRLGSPSAELVSRTPRPPKTAKLLTFP